MKQIKPVLEGIYKDPSLRKRIVPIFMGDPGLGKTFLVNEFVEFARKHKVNFVDYFDTDRDIDPKIAEYIASQVSPFEVSGIGIPDSNTKEMVYYNYHKLVNLKDGDILFFDELPNANPNVLNALLTLIEGRTMISGDKLPDIMIVAAGNWQGMTPMTPQIKRRFVWYDVKFNRGMWKEFMAKKYKMPYDISAKLCDLIQDEDFSGYNFNTSADLDKATEMIIKRVPTPYEKKIKSILETEIKNEKGDVILKEDNIWKKGESKSWLELVRYGLNINIDEEKDKDEFEILILNENDEVVGNVKDINVLKKMYHLSEEEIYDLKNGVRISSIPSQPGPNFFFFFFQKK